ncbi:MAG: septum formation initiator family protein [Immundisolibacterales bacterium]|nr:septum formation initiator family protein [Immundisolibacterales bacterium]
MAGKGGLRKKGDFAGMKRSRWQRRQSRNRILAGALLAVALAGLQFRLWFGDGGVFAVFELHDAIDAQQGENERLYARNRELEAEVNDFRTGLEAIEFRARRDLGMVRRDETFYQIVERR